MVTTKNNVFTETGRKWLHISMGLFALLLRFLPWWGALLCALAALGNNLFILPRLTGKFYREGTKHDVGIIMYPIAVFFIILFFPDHVYLAAALWGILSFGDGFATIFGIKYGRKKLPWNPNKSWIGSLAYIIYGWLAASFFIWWTIHPLSEGQSTLFFYLILPGALTLISAIMESLPFGVNDNILVPLVGAFFAYIIIKIYENFSLPEWELIYKQAIIGFLVTFAVGTISFVFKLVSIKGYIAGVIAGTILYSLTDWRGFIILVTFFVLASILTKIGYKRKEALGLAQEDSGARSTKHVMANMLIPLIFAVVLIFSGYNAVFLVAFAAAFATALSDTASSEAGQLWGKNAFMVTTFKRVKPGTDGAVSLEGTVAGLFGAFIIAAVAFFAGFISSTAEILLIVGIAGFLGNITESYMNAFIKDKSGADNELMNLLNTIAGSGLAMILFNLFST